MQSCAAPITCKAAGGLFGGLIPRYALTMVIVGIDEAGRGPLAGPVVAGAVILPADFNAIGLTDSKKLTARARDHWYGQITAGARWGAGLASVQEIEDINILQATFLAMRRAVENLACADDFEIWVDGNQKPKFETAPPDRVKCFIGGDALHACISAASVIAKVTRDRLMHELHAEFPQYRWDKNMGYGSAQHRAAILEHGPCPHHRSLFLRKIYGHHPIAA